MMTREFSVVIKKDEDGYYVASMPALRGCQTQANSSNSSALSAALCLIGRTGMISTLADHLWHSGRLS